MKITRNDAQEIAHKLGILADESDLQEDYGLTQSQSDALRDSVPLNGGEWNFPDWAAPAVRGELADHAVVLRNIAADCRSELLIGQALAAERTARRMESI